MIKKYKTVKIGMDVHLNKIVLVVQIDNSNPQRARSFSSSMSLWKYLLLLVSQSEQVYSCYEAGPFGYGLHRQLLKKGIINVVVCPQNWDERNKRVKTDNLDALALCTRLDRYVNGNQKSFSVVRVPDEKQELDRAESRHLKNLQKDQKRYISRGRGILLYHGSSGKGHWWKSVRWEELTESLDARLLTILKDLKRYIEELEEVIKQLKSKIEASYEDSGQRAKSMGAFTLEFINREVCQWDRFKNRRQVGSYTGLCPGEHSSGGSRQQGSINKCGNRLLRYYLIEMSWRMLWKQKQYKPVAKRLKIFEQGSAAQKKKAIVAIARILAIDLWRLNTGQTTLENLNLVPMD